MLEILVIMLSHQIYYFHCNIYAHSVKVWGGVKIFNKMYHQGIQNNNKLGT
jgi:hypothetical protein